MLIRRVTALVCVSVLLSCGDADGPGVPNAWSELHAARWRWSMSGVVDYEYGYTRLCECLPTDLSEPRIEVRNGAIVRVWDERSGAEVPVDRYGWYLTVTALFAAIENAIAEGVHQLDVDYDPTLGYPLTLFIDYDAQMADEELILTTIGPVIPLN
jgi:hypothetical protein